MPDDIVPALADAVEPAAPVTPEPAPDEGAPVDPEPAKPHPLQPGGVRFEEVYGKWKTAEGRLTELERQMEAERALREAQAAKAQAPRVPTRTDIQAALDRGEIDALQAAELIADAKARESEARIAASFAQREKVAAASADVQRYVDAVPALADRASEEFRRVAAAAQELAAEIGRPVSDPVVQRRALQIALGPVERLAVKRQAEGYDRRTTEGGGVLPGGGGTGPQPKADPLKGIPKPFADYWRGQGLTDAQIAEQAKYLSPAAKTRLGG